MCSLVLSKAMEKENGVQLENIVYYRGETHYFVMTALRASLIERGVILEDKEDRKSLMAPSNINRAKLHEVGTREITNIYENLPIV